MAKAALDALPPPPVDDDLDSEEEEELEELMRESFAGTLRVLERRIADRMGYPLPEESTGGGRRS